MPNYTVSVNVIIRFHRNLAKELVTRENARESTLYFSFLLAKLYPATKPFNRQKGEEYRLHTLCKFYPNYVLQIVDQI